MESVAYQLTETVIRRTLLGIQDSPERTVRNLIDMALHFADGRFEREFFTIARRLLEDDQSAYYNLVKDAAMNVQIDDLVRFGMNLGFNGCVVGAKTIRELEEKHGFNIPWSLTLKIDADRFDPLKDRYHELIAHANRLGIYTFLIRAKGSVQEMLSLVSEHANCAFALFCGHEQITPAFVNQCETLHHMMPVVRLSERADEACALLRKHKRLYAVEEIYGPKNARSIVSGELFDTAQTLHPALTLLTPQRTCPDDVSRQVYESIRHAREEQQYATIPLDVVHDFRLIDSIISCDACSACFDEDGVLFTSPDQPQHGAGSVFDRPLFDMLRESFPKG